MLKRTVPRWLDQPVRPLRLVVPSGEYAAHVALRDEQEWEGVYVVSLPRGSWGIGASRHFCVEHAYDCGYDEIIITDDDYRPARGTDVRKLLEAAQDPYALGVGAVRSLLDRFNHGKLSELSGPILCPGGWGFMVYALNLRNVRAVGSFDPELSFCEDAELMRNGVTHGLPWRVHCDVWTEALAKRYEPGGIASTFRSPDERAADEARCLRLIESRWPKYQKQIAGGKSRMSWVGIHDDYMPGWRERSALHGGRL